ncbi:hypothetical protein LC724_05835 [Blautia sp. RD014234]|nr:hypothetical protein [Blautia parvula]
MADREMYLQIAALFAQTDEITIETTLMGEQAGQKKILTGEERMLPPGNMYTGKRSTGEAGPLSAAEGMSPWH